MNRYVRIKDGSGIFWGKVQNNDLVILDKAPWENPVETGSKAKLDISKLAAPVTPSKIVLIGRNYPEHIKEMAGLAKPSDEPIIFTKPPTAVIGPNDAIPRYAELDRVDYEGELGAIIGKKIFRGDINAAKECVFGYTCVNDVTARNLQKKDGQWTRAKGFDGFCPVGPWIVTDIDPLDLKIETYLNNERRQSGRTSEQIWNIFNLIVFISSVMTLLPGDLISTGTPEGVGPMNGGDIVRIEIENIGVLENKVISA
ncbi:MAG TPA: 2-hydroxyhepta-2,4-diene-1,7-dioate isomerase [candidate division Zixibacteria bacterium]|nr:2-hydroxyhepta-2,4-diene-1,7-dioate isomerase [candidate division Zixibacteria bacterium]HBZ00298.1 2-hydroxyhepta-2,4-diene-1,7-dioate isomerase [candidate division Zixibacteria bacterium]